MLSVIIPVYNEEEILEVSLNKLLEYLSENEIESEVIVVDDGSQDKSRQIAENFPVKINKKRQNKGKGYSVREGVNMAEGKRILFLDADLSTSLECIETFLEFSEEFNVIVGSRAKQKSQVQRVWHKSLLARLSNTLIRNLLQINVKDTQCGFKMFTKKTARKLFDKQKIDGYGFDFEILMLAKKEGIPIKEAPVEWSSKKGSDINIKDYFKTFLELVKVKLYEVFNRY
ncbi:MAG: dolichyl-phosphate beta-glucosyltransferase [Candidatus Magasanikbacteria bacterium]